MVTDHDEAVAVGGKGVPILGAVVRVRYSLWTGTGLHMEPLSSGDTYLCFGGKRILWFTCGFWAVGGLILDETPLRVSEVRNMLEGCGGTAFTYQRDGVHCRESPAVLDEMKLRCPQYFRGARRTPDTLNFEPTLKNPLSE